MRFDAIPRLDADGEVGKDETAAQAPCQVFRGAAYVEMRPCASAIARRALTLDDDGIPGASRQGQRYPRPDNQKRRGVFRCAVPRLDEFLFRDVAGEEKHVFFDAPLEFALEPLRFDDSRRDEKH